jgi:alkanesulfonate monooxygenase SsuD/methylene tetrahydromethanopterin reductase-like flavin-dependent oxidoreductase (luciferase family)
LGKLKFCVFLPFHTLQAKDIQPTERFNLTRNIVLESEKLGYHSIWLDDHLMYKDWPILESWAALSALSSLTSKIRLGTMVTCSTHRNPALLAKMAATLDVISGGRLELGIGAGIQKQEHIAYGFDFPKLSVRVERLVEALEVIRRLWTDEKANYQGKHYTLKDAVCAPKPLQLRPPITVGGSSELLMQKATAPYADRFDCGLLSIEIYKRKLQFLENQCKQIGRNFNLIEKSCWPSGQILIAQNKTELCEKITQLKPTNVSLEEFRKTTLFGTPDECIEQLQVYRKLGVTCFMLYFADFPKLDCLRLFAQKVANRMDF